MFIVFSDDTVNDGVIIIIFKHLHPGFILILDFIKLLQTLDKSSMILLQ